MLYTYAQYDTKVDRVIGSPGHRVIGRIAVIARDRVIAVIGKPFGPRINAKDTNKPNAKVSV
jgi:hypothetical protein